MYFLALFFVGSLLPKTLFGAEGEAAEELGQKQVDAKQDQEIVPEEELETSLEEWESSRAESVLLLDESVRIPRPSGWRIVRAFDNGAVVTFRHSSDDEAQIEVRMSEDIPLSRWDRFFRTFDNDLLQSGFEVERNRPQAVYGGRRGRMREYTLSVNETNYRLVTWHVHEHDRAWIFTGFFRETRRDAHFRTFEELLNSVDWNVGRAER